MRIAACYKNVPDNEKIKLAPDNSLDLSAAAPQIGQYDLNAVEAAVEIAAGQPGTEIIALTVAGDVIDNTKQRKAILSRGADRMVGVKGEFENADTFEIASAIAAAVEKLGDVDLLIFGEGSADMYAQQTGVAAGAILGWPNVNAVSHLELEADGSLLVRRDTESCSETIRVKLPAVVSVTSDINRPRIPSMKDILAAGKKPVEVLDAAQLGLSSQAAAELVSIRAQEQKARACQVYETASDEALNALAQEIRKLM